MRAFYRIRLQTYRLREKRFLSAGRAILALLPIRRGTPEGRGPGPGSMNIREEQ